MEDVLDGEAQPSQWTFTERCRDGIAATGILHEGGAVRCPRRYSMYEGQSRIFSQLVGTSYDNRACQAERNICSVRNLHECRINGLFEVWPVDGAADVEVADAVCN